MKAYERLVNYTENLEIVMLNAETGQRGFIITNDDGYLDVYRHATEAFPLTFALLLNEAEIDPRAHGLVVEMSKVANAKMLELAKVITVRRQIGFEAASREVQTHLGKDLMEDFHRHATVLSEFCQSSVENYRMQTQEIARWASTSLVMAVASIALWLILVMTPLRAK